MGDSQTRHNAQAAGSGPNLGTGSVPRLLLELALPAIAAQLVNLLYNVVDRVFIGHIAGVGADALTGVGLCAPIIVLITACAALCGSGGAPRAAMRMGQDDADGAERIMGNCFSLLVLCALVLTAAFLVFARPLLTLFGASADTLPYALAYTRIYVAGTLFVMVALGMNTFITTQGFANVAMATTLIGAVANIVLDPVLIFAAGLGVAGAAAATVASQALSAAWVMRFLLGRRTKLKLRVSTLRLRARIVLPCLALGSSMFVQTATESLISICYNSSLAGYGGDVAVGTMTILSTSMQLVMMPLHGIAQGAQPIMSFNYGSGDAARVKQAFRCAYIVCIAYTLLFWVVAMLAPGALVGLFTDDAQLVGYATGYARVYFACVFVMGSQVVCQLSFVALGQARVSLVLALVRKVVLITPLIYILPAVLPVQPVFAVFLAEPVGDVLASATTTTTFFTRLDKTLAHGAESDA